MTTVADFIPMWETAVGTEMFPKSLLEQGRANLVTALVQFSNNHNLSYKTQHEDVQRCQNCSKYLAAIGGFKKHILIL